MAGVEPEVGVVDDDVIELLVGETVGREVKPEKIRTFGLNQSDLGHLFGEERFRLLVIALDVGKELLEPVGAVLIGGLGGEEAERVGLAVAGRRDLGAEALAQFIILDEDVRDLQAGEVEGLRRRGAGDGLRRNLRREGGERRVLEAQAHELLVNLVGDDQYAVLEADRGDAQQFLARPDAAGRIVRAAEQEELDFILDDLIFKVGKVDLVVAVFEDERAVDEQAPVLADDLAERVVDGLLQEDGVAGLREAAHGRGQRKDDARRDGQGLRRGRPAVVRCHPVDDGLLVRFLRVGVAEDAVLDAARELFDDGLRRAEVHIGDPERQDALRVAALDGKVVFEARGAAAVDDCIEIGRHRITRFLYGFKRKGVSRSGPGQGRR